MATPALDEAVALTWDEDKRTLTLTFGGYVSLNGLRPCVKRTAGDLPEALTAGEPVNQVLERLHRHYHSTPDGFGWRPAADGLIHVLSQWSKVGSCSRVDATQEIVVHRSHDASPEELHKDITVLLGNLSLPVG